MSIIISPGGKMNTATVENITKEMSADATETGGRLAKSDQEILAGAFPTSPLPGFAGTYDTTKVSGLKSKMTSNTVKADDMGDVQAYWGWNSPTSDEENMSSGDLTFSGAPDIPNVEEDTDGNKIASPYMPNLVPPETMSPIMDNQTAIVLNEDAIPGVSLPPFTGDGLANPKATSDLIHSTMTEADESGYTTPEGTPVTG